MKMNFNFIICLHGLELMQPVTDRLQYDHERARFNSVKASAFLAQTAVVLIALIFASSAAWANEPS